MLDRAPDQVFVDGADAGFISVRALSSLGQLLLGVESVTLVTRGGLAATVLELLGFGDVACVDLRSFDPGERSDPGERER